MGGTRAGRGRNRSPEDHVVDKHIRSELQQIVNAPIPGFHGLRVLDLAEHWSTRREEGRRTERYEELIGSALSHALIDPQSLAAVLEFVDPQLLNGRCRGCCRKLPPRERGTRGRPKEYHGDRCRQRACRNRKLVEAWHRAAK
jgi:hypothetical protein